MHIRIPLAPHLAPPRRRASVPASLLKLPVHVRAGGAVVGEVPWRHLGVFGAVVEGVGVVGRAGWGAAHVVDLGC